MPLMNNMPQHQRGLTLIELMISITIGLFVVSALTYLISTSIRTNTDTMRATHLNQELRTGMQAAVRDLRRTGYRYGNELAGVFSSHHALAITTAGTTITVAPPSGVEFASWINGSRIRHVAKSTGKAYCVDISSFTSTSATGTFVNCGGETAFPSSTYTAAAGSWTIVDPNGAITPLATCISFGYDRDQSGGNDTGNGDIDVTEQIGYRFDAVNHSFQMGSYDGAAGEGADCTSGNGTWTDLINPAESGIRVTSFSVTKVGEHLINTGNVQVNVLELELTLSGELDRDTSVKRTITESVKVRNDQVI